ncbi:MAG: hypothetical protein A2X13_12285 [Bacteroidetes bacterium GWC2_33_15]|nr:MAG: hypothetical protein A2X10_14415 [Bacteroidetes bacterium GWA2_33_15]OFX50571.1 MAG: hypothetical protein A2X13_12285 [Bacteroidetes bacterium GWC2_33_15]OFX64108.1 MAG: hypothetical protein A2X15_02735 [Bacteroidetes bacterium GWB2_32_14]OFX69720.1 MAG: hypothetical protein A2X14_04960 [Bacteroidetes bacterium GWD2_33_33]HAN19754.1 hypothetical protein [Bacteroidales bacterium]
MYSNNQYLPDEIISAFGWTFVNVLWQGFLIAFLMGLVLKLFINFSSQTRYYIALASLLLIVGLAVINFSNNYDPPGQKTTHKTNLETGKYEQVIKPGYIPGPPVTQNQGKTYLFALLNNIDKYFPLLLNIWLAGILFYIVRFITGLIYSQKLRYSNIIQVPEKWERKFYSLSKKLSINKRIKYLESKILKVPVVLGYLKPVIIVPAGMLTGIPENQVEAIIAHELAHIKRNDYLVNILQTILEMIFFFHPAVWYISSTIRTERENCCDDIALTACDESLIYAKALVSVQEFYTGKVYSAVAFSGQKKQLLNRIKRMIMKPEMKSNLSDKIIATLIVILGIVVLTVSTNLNAESSEPKAMVTDDINVSQIVNPELIKPVVNNNIKKIVRDTSKTVIKNKIVVHESDINIENNTVVKKFTDKDGKKKEMKFTLKNGKVIELFVDGKEIPESEYSDYQPEIDETIADLKEAKEDIKKAIKEVEEIDVEKIKKEVEESMAKVHIDMEKINEEIARSMEEAKNIDVEEIMKEVEMNIKDIDFDKQMIEIQESLKEIQNIDMEEVKLQIEEARKQLEHVDFEEIRLEIEKNKEQMIKEIDMESIQKEILKAQEEIAKIDMEKIRIEMDESLNNIDKAKIINDMEKDLEKLEGLELEEK